MKQTIKELDKTVTELTDKYISLHGEFDTYRGRLLKDEELKECNKIIDAIHATYKDIHEVAFWVAHRYEWALNISNSHEHFLDDLVEATGKQHEEN